MSSGGRSGSQLLGAGGAPDCGWEAGLKLGEEAESVGWGTLRPATVIAE
jgi:hypothetical protein